MTDPEYLFDGLWRALLETERALEEQENQRIPIALVALLLTVVDGLNTHWPEIASLIRDLDRLGHAQ